MYTIRLIMYLVIDVIDAIAEYYIYIPIYDYSSLGTVIIYLLDLLCAQLMFFPHYILDVSGKGGSIQTASSCCQD